MNELEDILGKENVLYNEPMSKHTTFKVGGIADVFAIVDTQEKLEKIIKLNKKITIVGNGSNLLVKDKGIRGIVIKYTSKDFNIEGTNITVSSGMTNTRLANILLKNELTGFEFASGIPGTIGGSLVMNAGAYGKEMKDIVLKTEYINLDKKEIKTLTGQEHEFSYRKSKFQNLNCFILKTTLKLEQGKYEQIKNTMEEYAKKRNDNQPIEFSSAGSTFKRIDGYITAKLIDEAGLKGYKIGGAEISKKHAGFIINSGNATAKDIMDLIEHVEKVVYEKNNVKIEPEIKIIGE